MNFTHYIIYCTQWKIQRYFKEDSSLICDDASPNFNTVLHLQWLNDISLSDLFNSIEILVFVI